MQRLMMVAAGAVLFGTGLGLPAGSRDAAVAPGAAAPVQQEAYFATVPPAAWMPADTADSLYRLARQALNRSQFQQAAELFQVIRTRFAESAYAADAHYWEAFARYRLGGGSNLRQALALLELQREKYPNATTRRDAESLSSRINADLARFGYAESALAVAQRAAEAAEAPVAPAPPSPAVHGVPVAPAAPVARPSPRSAAAPLAYGHDDHCEGGDDTAIFALQALMRSRSERAVPLLRKVLARRDSASVCLRRMAMMVAAQQDREGTDLLLSSARNDPDPEVRGQAIFWLSQSDDPRVVPVLDSVIRGAGDEELQGVALFALSRQRSPEARQILRTYAERDDIDPELTERALFFLAQSGSPEDIAFLRDAYKRVEGTEARQRILAAMMAHQSPEQARWLLGIARDRTENIEVRKQALFFAGMSDLSTTDLLEVYNSMPDDPELRKHMLIVLGQRMDDESAVTHLLQIARTEKDPDIRRTALFWLSQSDDPRVTEMLEELLVE